MLAIKSTKSFFLWGMSVVYLFAFASIYHQIPGLYGDNGLLPVRSSFPLDGDENAIKRKAAEKPNMIWLAKALGLEAAVMMEFLALIGIVISFGALIWSRMREATNFVVLWLLYFSLYQAGQIFTWFQWDILLLEAGFITIIVAPLGILNRPTSNLALSQKAHDNISLWLVRWLLFRLMFASGLVKLTSQCPTWWGLTALNVHFESQCIPTPLAWFFHHFPDWILRLGVVATYVIEIAVPFLFFSPLRTLRLFSFNAQLLFQISIILTGNYNFFNILTIVLCISLLDDEYLGSRLPDENKVSFPGSLIEKLIKFGVYGALSYWTVTLFGLRFAPDMTIVSRIMFTQDQFALALTKLVPLSIAVGVASLSCNILLALYNSFNWPGGFFSKFFALLGTIITSGAAIWIFCVSLVPHTVIDRTTSNSLWPVIRSWHSEVDRFHVVNSYGLFRRMTGVGGRPEIIIEGSNSLDSGWKEINFLYKPGNKGSSPPFIVPHQPRLDWQMWFAALGTYKENPWLASFMYRLLMAQPEVLNLIDLRSYPFHTKAPKYLRAHLYTYKFTPFEHKAREPNMDDWWIRTKKSEYFPVVSRDHQPLLDYLKAAGIPTSKRPARKPDTFLKKLIFESRQYVERVTAHVFIWSIFSAGLAIKLLNAVFRA